MAELEITTMSSKGQIVIPHEMRKEFHDGEQFVVIKTGKHIILKSVTDFEENIKDDIAFAKKTEDALKRYEQGSFKKTSGEEFLKALDQW